jgi:hypothetical protein
MGLWAALAEVFPRTRHQRCLFHKTDNVLKALPKSQHGRAKAELQAIWVAATAPSLRFVPSTGSPGKSRTLLSRPSQWEGRARHADARARRIVMASSRFSSAC